MTLHRRRGHEKKGELKAGVGVIETQKQRNLVMIDGRVLQWISAYTPPPLRLVYKIEFSLFFPCVYYLSKYLTSRRPMPLLRLFQSARTRSSASESCEGSPDGTNLSGCAVVARCLLAWTER